jgi:hypothetical protein
MVAVAATVTHSSPRLTHEKLPISGDILKAPLPGFEPGFPD